MDLYKFNHLFLKYLIAFYLIFTIFDNKILAWDNEELELYDLVEELGITENFYDILGVAHDASEKEIRSAYRKLSVKTHPDKNPSPDASTKFRQLVGIYEALKNQKLREVYDLVLVEGLPNWKQPVFYFRRARKLEIWQVIFIVLSIITVGQYLASWGSYFEMKLTQKEKIKKVKIKRGGQKEKYKHDDMIEEIPRPSIFNTAPFQLFHLGKYMIFQMPKDIINLYNEIKERKIAEEERKAQEEKERLEDEIRAAEERSKKVKKRKVINIPVKEEGEEEEATPIWGENAEESHNKSSEKKAYVSGGLWTDDAIGDLAKLCSKYPGGTPERWEKIADELRRPVPEITFMAKKVLEKLASRNKDEIENENSSASLKVKVKTKGGKIGQIDDKSVENWTVEEQKLLEKALQLYPKGSSERWDKISNMISTKSKDECVARYKYIAEQVKKKKEETSEIPQQQEAGKVVEKVESQEDTQEEEAPQIVEVAQSGKGKKKKRRRNRDEDEEEDLEDELKSIEEEYLSQDITKNVSTRKSEERQINKPKEERLSRSRSDSLSKEELLAEAQKEERKNSAAAAEKDPANKDIGRQNSNSSSSSENDWCVIEENQAPQ